MGSLIFTITDQGSGTLTPTGMNSWNLDPRPYTVVQEVDVDGIIGKPLGAWGGQTATAIITETSVTCTNVIAKVRAWLTAYNAKGTVVVTQEDEDTTYLYMRLTSVSYERLDAVNYRLTLAFTQEVE